MSRRLFCFFFLRLKKEDNGQPRTSVPTVRKQAFIFSHTKRALRARRAPQTVRWTVCSQSGEQFIIATRGFKPGTQSQVSRCLFASFSALEKEVTTHSRGRKSLQIPSPSAVAATSPERRGFKIRLTCKQKKLISPLYLNRKTNSDTTITPAQKFFAYFLKKYGAFLQKTRSVIYNT